MKYFPCFLKNFQYFLDNIKLFQRKGNAHSYNILNYIDALEFNKLNKSSLNLVYLIYLLSVNSKIDHFNKKHTNCGGYQHQESSSVTLSSSNVLSHKKYVQPQERKEKK